MDLYTSIRLHVMVKREVKRNLPFVILLNPIIESEKRFSRTEWTGGGQWVELEIKSEYRCQRKSRGYKWTIVIDTMHTQKRVRKTWRSWGHTNWQINIPKSSLMIRFLSYTAVLSQKLNGKDVNCYFTRNRLLKWYSRPMNWHRKWQKMERMPFN